MNGVTMKGVELKGTMPASPVTNVVPSGNNLNGQTGDVSSKKSSNTAGFSASKKCGSVKGNSY